MIGIALANNITNVINLVLITIYIGTLKDIKEAWFYPTAECFKGLGDQIKLGI